MIMIMIMMMNCCPTIVAQQMAFRNSPQNAKDLAEVALQTVFLVFPQRISVFLTPVDGFLTSPLDRRRSVDSKTHLGKWNRSSVSRDTPRRSCIADCISCISTAYFCISDVPGRISDLTSRTASIRRFRNSPRKAKSVFWKLIKTSQKFHCRLYFLYFHSVFLYFRSPRPYFWTRQ